MDKIVLKFFADVMYLKEKLCIEEYEDIMQAENFSDLDRIVEKMLSNEYTLLRGETYGRYAATK